MFELATFKWSIDFKGGADCSLKKRHAFLKYDTSSELLERSRIFIIFTFEQVG